MKKSALLLCLCIFGWLSIPASAQLFSANVGGGFSEPVYNTGQRLDMGWNFGAGVGINPIPYFGVMLNFGFDNFAVNRAELARLSFPDGHMRVWDFSLDPVIRFGPHGPVSLYITGGGGVYHRTVEFTRPTIATVTAFDPFFGIFYPVAVPANQVLASYTVTKPGVDGGAGLNFGSWHSLKFYAEARYRVMFTSPNETTWVPVTFGIRF
ncbi:MAG TPA: outer membrane beta-barrel protein [Bryobacteraceae bacterium]|nr:outer membrane beta-barrel protein [Bryobacteraceae bacterium]